MSNLSGAVYCCARLLRATRAWQVAAQLAVSCGECPCVGAEWLVAAGAAVSSKQLMLLVCTVARCLSGVCRCS